MSSSLRTATAIRGFLGAALVDRESGLLVAKVGGMIDLRAAVSFGLRIVEAMLRQLDRLGMEQGVKEILIAVDKQMHVLRPIEKAPGVLLYVCLDARTALLGMARLQIERIEDGVVT